MPILHSNHFIDILSLQSVCWDCFDVDNIDNGIMI